MTYEEALHSGERIIEFNGYLICFANLDENNKKSEALFDEYIDRAIEFYKKHGNPETEIATIKNDLNGIESYKQCK